MVQRLLEPNSKNPFKCVISFVLTAFMLTTLGPMPEVHAQTIIDLPNPGTMVNQSVLFNPLKLKGIQINPQNPLRFEFLVDKGDSVLTEQPLKDEILRLTKYFLTCLTVPEKDLWVNLSPYEKDRIAADHFGFTQMGKDLLEQDYLLKQIVATLSYPEKELGGRFWQKIYEKSYALYGTTNIPVNTFNKVWIVPKSADVYVRGNSAFVSRSELDVMLETDYLALQKNLDNTALGLNRIKNQDSEKYAKLYAQVVREVILPELRKEVNQGKNFAILRQVYDSMILATWYKKHLKNSLLGKVYVGRNKVTGVDVDDRNIKEKIFQQYLMAFKKRVYNYIKEDYDPMTQKTVPRKYVSGGMAFEGFGIRDTAYNERGSLAMLSLTKNLALASIDVSLTNANGKAINIAPSAAMITGIKRFLNKSILPVIFLSVASFTASAPLAKAMSLTANTNGTITIQVEEGDKNFGSMIEQWGQKVKGNPSYVNSILAGPLWGQNGAVKTIAGHQNVDLIHVGDQITVDSKTSAQLLPFVPGAVPATPSSNVSNSSSESKEQPGTVRHATVTSGVKKVEKSFVSTIADFVQRAIGGQSDQTKAKPSTPIAVLKNSKGRIGLSAKTQVQKPVGGPPPEETQLISKILLGLIMLGIGGVGISKVWGKFSFSPTPVSMPSIAPLPTTPTASPVAPKKTTPLGPRRLTRVQMQYHKKSSALSNQAQVVEPPKSLAPRSINTVLLLSSLGALAGMALEMNRYGLDLFGLIASGVTSFFATPIFTMLYAWVAHEIPGHALPIAVKQGWKTGFSANNLKLNLNGNQWLNWMFRPWKLTAEDNPQILPRLEGDQDKLVSRLGFYTTAGITGLLLGGLAHYFGNMSDSYMMPLLGPAGVGALGVLAGSFISDILGKSSKEGYPCSVYVTMSWGTPEQMEAPQELEIAIGSLHNMSLFGGNNGVHSSGYATIEPTIGGVEILMSKVVEAKHGTKTSYAKALEQLRKASLKIGKPIPMTGGTVTRIRFGHTRFLTSPGNVSKKTSHPFVDAFKELVLRKLNGQLVSSTELMQQSEGMDDGAEENAVGSAFNGDVFVFRKMGYHKAREVLARLMHRTEPFPSGDAPLLNAIFRWLRGANGFMWPVYYAFVHTYYGDENEFSAANRYWDEQEHKTIVGVYNDVLKKHTDALSTIAPDGSFADTWYYANADDNGRDLPGPMQNFKDDLVKTLYAKRSSLTTKLTEHWQKEEDVRAFVDMAVERFFTADGKSAMDEFVHNSTATNGTYIVSSAEPNRLTVLSRKQPLYIGFNRELRILNVSSTLLGILTPFQTKSGKTIGVDQVILVEPFGLGTIGDIEITSEGELKIILTDAETGIEKPYSIYDANELNPKFTPYIRHEDPRRPLQQEETLMAAAVEAVKNAFDDPDSYTSKAAHKKAEQWAALWVRERIEKHRAFDGLFALIQVRAERLSSECRGMCGEAASQMFQAERIASKEDSILWRFFNRQIAQVADSIAHQIMAENARVQWADVVPQLPGIINEQLNVFLGQLNPDNLNTVVELWQAEHDLPQSTRQDEVHELVVGYDLSYYYAQTFVNLCKAVLPNLKIVLEGSNAVVNHRDLPFELNQVDGATFFSRHWMQFATKQGVEVSAQAQSSMNKIFGVSLRLDTPAVTLGQDLNSRAPMQDRIFPVGEKWKGPYPATEATITSDVLMMAYVGLLSQRLIHSLAATFPGEKPFGLAASAYEVSRTEALMVRSLMNDAIRIGGRNPLGVMIPSSVLQYVASNGKEVFGDVHDLVVARGERKGVQFWESFASKILGYGYVVAWAPLVGGALSVLTKGVGTLLNWPHLPLLSPIATWITGHSASAPVRMMDGAFTLALLGMFIPWAYRWLSKRDVFHRFGSFPNISIISMDESFANLEYLWWDGLFSRAYASFTTSIYAEPINHAVARLKRKLGRGSVIRYFYPTEDIEQNDMVTDGDQLAGTRTEAWWTFFFSRSGPERNTASRAPKSESDTKATQNIVVGGADLLPKDASDYMRTVYRKFIDRWPALLMSKVEGVAAMNKMTWNSKIRPYDKTTAGALSDSTPTVHPREEAPLRRSTNALVKAFVLRKLDSSKVESDSSITVGKKRGGSDAALVVSAAKVEPVRNPGGITMNNRLLQMNIHGDQAPSFDEKALEMIPVHGIVPELRALVPVTPRMLMEILGGMPGAYVPSYLSSTVNASKIPVLKQAVLAIRREENLEEALV